ncbi:unnamed protein product [Arabis nemorensis]|uniref:Uncharacterized protein n=1 Tax=Arabis nemorensis TaxID=586526 RepID=A0A565BGQ1_9BRAS|nr:unnamed protein product [Arabis nemorensis]
MVISNVPDKGNGLVFNFETQATLNAKEKVGSENQRLMTDAIRSGRAMGIKPLEMHTQSEQVVGNFLVDLPENQSCSMVFRAGPSLAGYSVTSLMDRKPRRRPNRATRRKRKVEDGQLLEIVVKTAPKKLFDKGSGHALEPGEGGDQGPVVNERVVKRKGADECQV